jgi:hypothetical protein
MGMLKEMDGFLINYNFISNIFKFFKNEKIKIFYLIIKIN